LGNGYYAGVLHPAPEFWVGGEIKICEKHFPGGRQRNAILMDNSLAAY
jgi:hypothetical protein